MSAAVEALPEVPAEVLEFAAANEAAGQLPAALEVARDFLPGYRLRVGLAMDPEIEGWGLIVIEAAGPELSLEEYTTLGGRWNDWLLEAFPSPTPAHLVPRPIMLEPVSQ